MNDNLVDRYKYFFDPICYQDLPTHTVIGRLNSVLTNQLAVQFCVVYGSDYLPANFIEKSKYMHKTYYHYVDAWWSTVNHQASTYGIPLNVNKQGNRLVLQYICPDSLIWFRRNHVIIPSTPRGNLQVS
jgi:hypothetical protein